MKKKAITEVEIEKRASFQSSYWATCIGSIECEEKCDADCGSVEDREEVKQWAIRHVEQNPGHDVLIQRRTFESVVTDKEEMANGLRKEVPEKLLVADIALAVDQRNWLRVGELAEQLTSQACRRQERAGFDWKSSSGSAKV